VHGDSGREGRLDEVEPRGATLTEAEEDRRPDGTGDKDEPPGESGPLVPSDAAARPASTAPDALDVYLREARRFPRLSAEEERALAESVYRRRDREAAKRLILHHLWLVIAIAREYRRMSIDLLDLIQEGSLGLMEAVERFDPFQGTRFATYARYWIRAYILRHLLANQRIVDLGRTRAGRKLFFRLQKERAALEGRGLAVTPMLLEDQLGVERAEIARLEPILRADVSLDRPVGPEEDSRSLVDTLADPSAEAPAAAAAQADLDRTLRRLLAEFEGTLSDERDLVVWREHLMAESPVPLAALGARYGVSKQRIGQIADRLKRRCREHVVSVLGPETELGWLFEER
jgi:RNA polymerase sigma-32 factor